jgi:hypothetical protein
VGHRMVGASSECGFAKSPRAFAIRPTGGGKTNQAKVASVMRAEAARGKMGGLDGKTAHEKPPGETVPPEGIPWAEC